MEDVVLRAGGTGTRLRPYTRVLLKPLMPVGDMTVLGDPAPTARRRQAGAGQPRHRSSGAAATIAVLAREVPIDFGVVHSDGDTVASFEEKPVLSYNVSMGVYMFERHVVDLIPRGVRYDFPDLLAAVLERGWAVHAYRFGDFWLDIGRPEDYELAVESFADLRDELLPPG
jgi:NDP-sugar pyrophosphorylase family protein